MAKWQETRRGDLGLRSLGLGACALSYCAIRHVLTWHAADPAHWSPGPLAFLLTAIGFLGASVGTAMVAMGLHLFDQVEISGRWRPLTSGKPDDAPLVLADCRTTTPSAPVDGGRVGVVGAGRMSSSERRK